MRRPPILLLARASHPGPTVAVTVLAVLLAVAAEVPGARILALGIAVLCGQLTIGWTNDLIDAARDRQSGRQDKPVASGALNTRTVRVSIGVALLCCLACSPFFGYGSALLHLIAMVGGGWAYNLIAKRLIISFLPYAVAFGALPMIAAWAAVPAEAAPVWMVAVGALLGVGAHLANALPDLADDAATGIVGLPHRLGARRTKVITPLLLVGASLVAVLGPPGVVPIWSWVGLVLVLGLAVLSWRSQGKTPFRAVMGIALLDVIMLLARG